MGRGWTSAILLAEAQGARRRITGLSDRMLNVRLKELEEHGLIRREVVPSMPVRVFCHRTERGRSLVEAVHGVTRWAHAGR